MMKKYIKYIFPLTLLAAFFNAGVSEGGIRSTKHNLSLSGPGPIKAAAEERICIFCHIPRKTKRGASFLWNRRSENVVYTPYKSSTLHSRVGQPTGASRVCLSCHDGTIALGSVVSESREIPFRSGIRSMPYDRPARLGTDLSDDHPVSFVYDSGLAVKNREIRDPALLPPEVKLDHGGRLQCTSCHDPHDDTYDKFLVMPNQYSLLCISCHDMDGWATSAHAISSAPLNRTDFNSWPNTNYQTVAENGCENCHRPHTASGDGRLLIHEFEEDNCLVCHNFNGSASDIELEISKIYAHPILDTTGVHDAAETTGRGTIRKHVACADCHNPHQANNRETPGAPFVSGPNQGVDGIDTGGQQVAGAPYLYEICFKCHADNNVLKAMPVTRQIDQLNTRLEFNIANPSFHPVQSPGVNPDVPSLLPPYNTGSIVFCTDCHGSDNLNGAKGPHGSIYKFILGRKYSTADNTRENSANYALCYKCHNRNSILNDESFTRHRKHIVEENTPCSACHDPHGISIKQGNSLNNSHLINFDLTIVQPDGRGMQFFEDTGRFSGRCFLNCHNTEHAPKEYP